MVQRIMAVAFGTELSNKAVKQAAELASGLGAQLFVLHVRSPMEIPHHAQGGALARHGDTITREIDEEERQLLRGAKEIAESLGVKAQTGFISDLQPYEGILRACRDQQCDLIVIGTRIRHGIPGYLVKSQTQKLLETTDIPVLVVR